MTMVDPKAHSGMESAEIAKARMTRVPPAQTVGVMPDHQRTGDSADVVKDREVGDDGIGKSMHRLQKIRIKVLCAMRQTSDRGHHQHQVDEVLLVMPEDPRSPQQNRPADSSARTRTRETSNVSTAISGRENQAAKKHPPPPEAGLDGPQSHGG